MTAGRLTDLPTDMEEGKQIKQAEKQPLSHQSRECLCVCVNEANDPIRTITSVNGTRLEPNRVQTPNNFLN